jgi:hypothetical protein
MSNWNYRILAFESVGRIYLQVHEVYYDKNGTPNGYLQNPINIEGETLKDIKWVINRTKEATKKSIICGGDKFPQEYKK